MKVSNNTLAVLLLFALVISVFGTLASVYYIDSLNLLTGRATDDIGNITLTVGATLSCTTDLDDISAFGSLQRSQKNSSENLSNFINLSNDGNQLINATVNATEQLWDTAAYNTPTSYWQIHCNSSTSAGACNATYANVQNGTLVHKVVYGLQPAAGSDQAVIGFIAEVPADEPTGTKNGQVTFWCSAN
nr:hypothetical protein [Nanoarchaeum sp.]